MILRIGTPKKEPIILESPDHQLLGLARVRPLESEGDPCPNARTPTPRILSADQVVQLFTEGTTTAAGLHE